MVFGSSGQLKYIRNILDGDGTGEHAHAHAHLMGSQAAGDLAL